VGCVDSTSGAAAGFSGRVEVSRSMDLAGTRRAVAPSTDVFNAAKVAAKLVTESAIISMHDRRPAARVSRASPGAATAGFRIRSVREYKIM
jgi:hypothetical protein